jgi:putative hydrolase of the HAD superfamily
MTQIVLFDLDNTLLDRQSAYARWARSFSESHGLGADAVDLLCEVDNDGFATRHDVFDAARRQLHLSVSIEDLITEYRKDYTELIQPDGAVIRALKRLRSHHFRIGIVTNGPGTQNEKIDRAGLRPLIDGCCISEEFGVEKPDVRIFHEAIRRCDANEVPAGAGWMVGDSAAYDIAGGSGAGLRTVWLARGRAWTEREFLPDVIASDLTAAVEQILSRAPSR